MKFRWLLFLVLTGCELPLTAGLQKANIIDNGKEITFSISNSSDKTGDVLFYARKGDNGTKTCVHIFEMRPGSIKRMSVPCRMPSGGGATVVNITWADTRNAGLIALASRLHVNW